MTQEAIQVSETPPLPGLQMVQQVNGALATIASDFAGSSDPAALAGAYMTWADTANQVLKRRNAANSAWVVIGNLSPIASQAEVDDGTNDDKFVTPMKLRSGFSINLAVNGHIKLPSWLGDFQLCWGTPTTAAGGGVAVAFSRAFTVPMGAVATVSASGVFSRGVTATLNATIGTFYVSNPSGGGTVDTVYYLAYGRG